MGERHHGPGTLAAYFPLSPLDHLAGFEGGQEDQVEAVDEEARGLVVELVDQVDYADPDAVCGFPQVALSAGPGLGRPADELVEMVT